MFLTFPAVTGVIAWQWFSNYSMAYAIMTSIWCTVFLEYWKMQEIDLSIRWNTRGINMVKGNRPQFKYTKVVVDKSGHTTHTFPRYLQISRQLLQIPFLMVATVALGAIITAVFAIEVLICETYVGPYQYYLVSTRTPSLNLIAGLTESAPGLSAYCLACYRDPLHHVFPRGCR
jgi:hypothetical protein